MLINLLYTLINICCIHMYSIEFVESLLFCWISLAWKMLKNREGCEMVVSFSFFFAVHPKYFMKLKTAVTMTQWKSGLLWKEIV